MNPLKRIKLKSMLRNCDYILAGTVIKQQYYDYHRRVEINHLIDQFMAEPGFEHALKLIEFNDMMVFYFTESCKGGLYVRKTEQLSEHTDHGSSRLNRELDREPRLQYDQPSEQRTVTAQEKAGLTSAHQSQLREIAGVTVYTADAERVQTAVLEPLSEDIEKSRQLQQLKESEEWMDQMIAKKPRFTPSELVVTPREPYSESNSRKPLGSTLDELFGKAAENPQPLGESFDEFLKQPMDTTEELIYNEAAPAREEPNTLEPEPKPKALEPKALEQKATDPEPLIVNDRSYPNVIATLQMDLFTLTKQLEVYRRNRPTHSTDEMQLKAKITSFEEAIGEFSEAIELLEHNSNKNLNR